jgi:hypothetical protein
MFELPREIRELMINALDEYAAEADGEMTPAELAEFIVENLVSAAEECGVEETGELPLKLTESGELETPLLEAMTATLGELALDSVLGEAILASIEELCDVEWSESEGFHVGFEDEHDDDDEDEDDY